MRAVFLFAAIAFLAMAPAQAAEPAPDGAEEQRLDLLNDYERARLKLDDLFAQLKREGDARAAQRLSRQIWDQWGVSGSATVDLMMQWAGDALEEKRFDIALDFLDQVVTMAPGYAEGWNRRATIHYMRGDYPKSMADIERTLDLEPRHFGALAGMGAIFKSLDRKPLALKAFQAVLDIYPMNRSAQQEVTTLSEELAGEGI